jgi:O-antigen ligase
MSVADSTKGKDKSHIYWVVLVVFMAISYLRPQDNYLSFLSPLKLPFLVSLILIFFSIKSLKGKKLSQFPEIKYFIAFVFLVGASTFHAVNTKTPFTDFWNLLFLYLNTMVPIILLISTRKKLVSYFRWLILIFFIVAIYGITHKGRGPGSFINDENDMAMAMCTFLPYVYFLIFSNAQSKKMKMFFAFVFFVMIVSIMYTFSRGGFLGLAVVLLSFWFFSNNRFKLLLKAALVLPIILSVMMLVVPDGYVEDMESISDTGNSTRNERFYSWGLAMDMFYDNPFLGVGAGNYPWNVVQYEDKKINKPEGQPSVAGRVAHSSLFTIIAEFGIVGSIVYFLIVFFSYRRIHTSKMLKFYDSKDDLILLMKATKSAILGYLTCSLFLTSIFYPHLFILLSYSVALQILYSNEIGEKRKYE